MHPINRVTTLAVALVSLVALPLRLRADPIAITGGTVQVSVRDSGAIITFLGDGFMVQTNTDSGEFQTAIGAAAPFPAGTSIDLGGVWQTSDIRGGQAIFNGVYYPELYFGFGQSGGNFATPSVTPTGLGQQILTVPFTFSGFVTASATPNPGPEDVPVFTANLFGRGTATAAFVGVPAQDDEHPGYYDTSQLPSGYGLEYVFSPVAAPIPEPGTMMLIGIGAIGLLGLRYRRVRRADTPGE